MAADNGTSTPEPENEPTTRVRIPRIVVVVLLASLIASCIVLFFFAGDAAAYLIAGRDVDKKPVLWVIRTVAVLVVIGALWLLIRIGYEYQWTGLGAAKLPKQDNVEFRPKKTLWDWLQLLIVPIVLALITVAFTWQQDARQQQIEEDRADRERAAEDRRADVDRQIEEQRADDAALQAYFDEMGTLLIQRDLRHSTEDNATEDSKDARILARARTLTVLARFDPSRKAEVMRFLIEAELVQGGVIEPERRPSDEPQAPEPVISLLAADLHGVALQDATLIGADLTDANLSNADLYNANLSNANLSGANLSTATLSNASLYYATLSNATLIEADLSNASLGEANLSGADLSGADLSGAYLRAATLSGARGWTEEQLTAAVSLNGTTMPNGQKYEDWLKSMGSGEDEENSGP